MNYQSTRQRRRRQHAAGPSFGSIVTTAVVAYGSYRLAHWAWNSLWADNDEEEVAQRARGGETITFDRSRPLSNSPRLWKMRRQRMTRCRDETIKALEGFLHTVRQTVEEKTNTSSETQALKKLRDERAGCPSADRRLEEEKELWDIIKVQTVTRMVATAYAHTILFLVLTVQVNLLGGRLFEEQMSNVPSAASMSNDSVASGRMGSYQESHRFVLMHTYEYFFSRGLVSLANTVERAVSDVLADWNVLDRSSLDMSFQTFDDAIQKIRNTVEKGSLRSSGRNRPRSLMRFLMPPSANMEVSIEDELARSILDETWDLLESPVLADAQQDCLNATFDMMREQYWGTIFEDARLPSGFTTKPLAHVLTQLKKTSNSFYSQEEIGSDTGANMPRLTANPYCAMMETLPAVLELADVCFN